MSYKLKPLSYSPSVYCKYDNLQAQTSLGVVSLEWKSWKADDAISIYINGDYLEEAENLDIAMQKVQDHIKSIVDSLIDIT